MDTIKKAGLKMSDGFDNKFVLTVSEDAMEVRLSIRVDLKKVSINAAEIMSALEELGVIHGLSEASVKNILKLGQVDDMLVAQGTPVVEGAPGYFESYLEQLNPRFGKEYDETEEVDLREFGDLILANKGDKLMRRVPAVTGKAGTNVFGESVPPPKYKDVRFANNLSGTAFHPEDSNLLISAIPGVPKLVKDGVSVDPILIVKGVNLASGNIEFDGALRVKGDIQSGMKVVVTGDIQVDGVIEAAEVRAEGNIVVKGGIIGNSSIKTTLNDPKQPNARIYAKNIAAKYIDSALVKATESITIANEIRQSFVEAGKRVSVGRKGSKRNAIVGGRVEAFEYVSSSVFGSESGTPTEVIVGASNTMMEEVYDLMSRIDSTKQEIKKLEQLLQVLEAKPGVEDNPVYQKTVGIIEQRMAELSDYTRKREYISAQLNPKMQPSIMATYQFYAGTLLQIRQYKTALTVDRPAGRALIIGNDIVIT